MHFGIDKALLVRGVIEQGEEQPVGLRVPGELALVLGRVLVASKVVCSDVPSRRCCHMASLDIFKLDVCITDV